MEKKSSLIISAKFLGSKALNMFDVGLKILVHQTNTSKLILMLIIMYNACKKLRKNENLEVS